MSKRPSPKLAVVGSQPVGAGLAPPSDSRVRRPGLWHDITAPMRSEIGLL